MLLFVSNLMKWELNFNESLYGIYYSKKIPTERLRTPFLEFGTHFETSCSRKPYPLGRHIPSHGIWECPPGTNSYNFFMQFVLFIFIADFYSISFKAQCSIRVYTFGFKLGRFHSNFIGIFIISIVPS